MQVETSKDMSPGGDFLREPGTYHLSITHVEENPRRKRDDTIIDNAAFKVYCEVLNGTVPGQEHKTTDFTFFWGKATDKNEGEFSKKKMSRFLLAVGLINPSDTDKKVEVDVQLAVGRHLIVKLVPSDDDPKYLQPSFADFYSVDDPIVKAVPKSESVMKMGGGWRKASGKARKPAATGGNGSTASKPPAKQPASGDDWSDV